MFRPNLHQKVLIAFLLLALLPLALLALYAGQHLSAMEAYLRVSTTSALDSQAAQALVLRAEMVASSVSDFLRSVEGDLDDIKLIPVSEENYLEFSRRHNRQLWLRAGSNEAPTEIREDAPLYRELAFVDPDGRERVRIVANRPTADLRDISDPANTTYLTEDYFLRACSLPPGEIYVSRVTGWHVNKEQQLRGAQTPAEAVEGVRYQGVVRFAAPVHGEGGVLEGVVVLSLDHRHLLEFTQHITPTEERFVVFPSYFSGNYAFMFDDEGWMIAHPKYWDIRGLDEGGELVPPYTADSSPEQVEQGVIPFNLFYADFVHPNYPVVADAVFRGRSGVADVTNVGGAEKIMAYAPILYDRGEYGGSGIFGGVTIGAQLLQFHKAALETSHVIRQEITNFVGSSWMVIVITTVLIVMSAYYLSQSITDPLLQLIAGTKEMAKGNLKTKVVVTSHDEVGELAASFNAMAKELSDRRVRLLQTLQALRRSRKEILQERNFKETVFENIETGILTLSGDGHVTSMNTPASHILGGSRPQEEIPLEKLLQRWPEILQELKRAPADAIDGHWSRYVPLEREGRGLTFRIALLPLSFGDGGSQILSIEDLTERVNLRQQMERMERLASLGRLAAGMAHEIRNPLTGVSLLLDDLHDRLLASPDDRSLIQKALGEIERLDGLVNELLNFASLPQPRLIPGSLAEVLRDTLFLVRKQCANCGVELIEDIPEAVPQLDMDPDKLKQAFLNLFNNALDAMPEGGTLTVTARIDSDSLQVEVRDSGEGIPAESIPLIFEPFYTSKGHGTGLGLSITHAIISSHGGRIEVQSQPGKGSSFLLRFPLQRGEGGGK